MQDNGLYANKEKSYFGMQSIKYLGIFIDSEGVHVDLEKIQVMKHWPTPRNLTELHSFWRLANFYRKFVFGNSHLSWPLNQSLQGGVKA